MIVKTVIHEPALSAPPPRPAEAPPRPQAAPRTAPGQAGPGVSEPQPAEMAKNFGKAVARWVGAGFPVVEKEVYDKRTAACLACPYWDGKARLGLGKCNSPGCGCTGLKRWLATEVCPHPEGSRWR